MVEAGSSTRTGFGFGWSDEALILRVEVDESGRPTLICQARPTGQRDEVAVGGERAWVPLLDVLSTTEGRWKSSRRYAESALASRLRYLSHQDRDEPPWHILEVALGDPLSRLEVYLTYKVLVGQGVIQSSARLCNAGAEPVVLEAVTSFLAGGVAGPGGVLEDVEIWWADNEWLGEDRWQRRAFRELLPDLGLEAHSGTTPRGMFGLTGTGSWSSGSHIPMGAALNCQSGHTWVWQIEHNGAWHWQVGEKPREAADARYRREGYLALLGPTFAEHGWRMVLRPGEVFETVRAAVAVSSLGFEAAVGALTRYRRAIRRRHSDHERLPVIFNDYMNTLMGDPTTERLLPLVDAAAKVGAEYFVIDSGWYAELGEPWWDTVGAWEVSKSRFPKGIEEVLDRIRHWGMVPGIWIEPEVVGVASPIAAKLPEEAFFVRAGRRVVENGRYQLDLSHPAARRHLDEVVDFLVGQLGIGYLKMDYNINIGPGTERDGQSAGAGLLRHNRAFLEWVEGLLDRHPGLTFESCASGGMRKDYATLARFQLQSTSDQQDFLRYAPIAAAYAISVAPEQGAIWAYPQPDWSEEEIVFSLCNAMLGRLYLSGHLERMSERELELVAEAVAVYKEIRQDVALSVPFWPLGIPTWDDEWLALGMLAPSATYIVLWRRGQANQLNVGSPERYLVLDHLAGSMTTAEILYSASGAAELDWQPSRGSLRVSLPKLPSAVLVRLR